MANCFVWTDDEAELLLRVTLDYKTTKWQENTEWESCKSKYSDILEAFLSQYPSSEMAGEKEFPHDKGTISKLQLTSKLKAIYGEYIQAVDSGTWSVNGRVVSIVFALCEDLWGESPATRGIKSGIESSDLQVSSENTSDSSTISDSSMVSPSSTHSPDAVRTRRHLLQAKLHSHRRDRRKRKMDPAVLEDLYLRRSMLELLKESERNNTESFNRIQDSFNRLQDSYATTFSTINDGFALLRQFMSQPQPLPAAFCHGDDDTPM